MVMPNFLIIGAAKGGTTSLYSYLNQHPQVYMSPNKEPGFFALEGDSLNFRGPDEAFSKTSITQLHDYLKLFDNVTDEAIAIGEASPFYLYYLKAARRIKNYIPNVKLIVSLRNPVDRAYASYMHNVRVGYEQDSFQDSLRKEEQRIKENWIYLWHYKQCGFYFQQLKTYFETFNREQIKVYLYDDLCKDTQSVVQDIFQFLGVDDQFIPDLSIVNASGIPKNRLVANIVDRGNPIRSTFQVLIPEGFRKNAAKQIRKWNLAKKPPLPEDLKTYLTEEYRNDIIKLQELIQRDLSSWLR